jgi:hypothetical protein
MTRSEWRQFMKKTLLLISVVTSISITAPAFAYQCKTTQAGTPTNVRDYCGTINADGTFSDGKSIYGVNAAITQELKDLAGRQTKVCVDACAAEGDLQVYNIVSPQ